jgi:beta-glucanase (GH16 family)
VRVRNADATAEGKEATGFVKAAFTAAATVTIYAPGNEMALTGLLANTRYRVSGWASTSDSQPMLIGVKDYGGTQKTAAFTGATLQFNTLTFTTGPNQTSATVFAYKPSGSGLADKISVQVADQGPTDEAYRLVWSDEFVGNGSLDASKWGFEQGFVRNQELQWYQPDNAVRSNGVLVIEGRRENRPNPNYEPGSSDYRKSRPTIQYSSSSLTSRGKAEFQYGRIEVRAKVTNVAGTWPAIWTLGTQCQWPSNGEVDIMENYGGNVLANFAFGTDQPYSAKWQSVVKPVAGFDDAWKDRFHVWELDWNPDRMSIYLDGELVNAIDLNTTVNGTGDPACAGRNPFRQKHYLLLNLALGGSAGGSVADLTFPTQYLVDYVRVYQKSGQ